MPLMEIDGRLVVTVDVSGDGYLDVANAALYVERSQSYVRALAKKGTLEFVADEEGNMTFHRDVLDAYNVAPKRGGRRPGEFPYKSLSSGGRRLRSVIRAVEKTDPATAGRETTLDFLQAMLKVDIAENTAE